MSSENYRYYCLDSTGHLYGAEWFDAANDAEAIALIEAQHSDRLCEIWESNRLVAKLSPQRLSA
jgi:hypothetical protein